MRALLGRHQGHYVYVLCRPEGEPFYVGKGVGFRCLNHEAEARNSDRLTHKLNVIRALWRRGESVVYRLDSLHETEADAHARERQLIAEIGRHDLGRGSLTNQTDGGEGAANPSEASRQRRRDSLWGETAEDPERAAANRYFQRLCSVRSVPIKKAASFRAEALRANRASFAMSPRQAASLAASAIRNRVLLAPGALIPRRLNVEGIELIIENGVGRDILSSRMAEVAGGSPGDERFRLLDGGFKYLVAELGADLLVDAGVLEPEFG